MMLYISLICFIAGLFIGAGFVYFGFKIGFRASYEIRECKDQEDIGKGLLKSKEPAEFELLGEQND